jgi:hypothetical protein
MRELRQLRAEVIIRESPSIVMPALGAGIHVFLCLTPPRRGWAGTSPAMATEEYAELISLT